MTIQDMHYDIKKKLNKVDSQQYRNLLVPEIDFALNEAQELFIKLIAEPRLKSHLGFEKSQRNTDDIRTIVESEHDSANHLDVTDNKVALPDNYMFYLSGYVKVSRTNCTKEIDITPIQHDDKSRSSYHYKSSFEWERINAEFNSSGIRFDNDGSFEIDKFCISYIRKPKYMHNAQAFKNGQYVLPSGTLLEGSENCELPDQTHREITDLAVMLLSGELELPGYQTSIAKLKLNQLN
jgi:hypothetical protein